MLRRTFVSRANVLFVMSSNDVMGSTGTKTGYWLEELATPYVQLQKGGHKISFASPKGGLPACDPGSMADDKQNAECKVFLNDVAAQRALKETVPLSQVSESKFDAVFVPGGHALCWDLPEDAKAQNLFGQFHKSKKVIAAVCHGPWALRHAKKNNGADPLLKGLPFTSFTESEEKACDLQDVVPFHMEGAAKELGADFVKKGDWEPHSVVAKDVNGAVIVTGQNPASSSLVAKNLLEVLSKVSE